MLRQVPLGLPARTVTHQKAEDVHRFKWGNRADERSTGTASAFALSIRVPQRCSCDKALVACRGDVDDTNFHALRLKIRNGESVSRGRFL